MQEFMNTHQKIPTMTKKQVTAEKLQKAITAKVIGSVTSPEEPQNKKVEETETAKTTTAEKIKKTAKKQAKNNLVEEVVAHRDVKYIYPADVVDTLARKSWRQQVRNQLRKLEREYVRIEDKNSKAYTKAKKAFEDYQKEVLKAGVKAA